MVRVLYDAACLLDTAAIVALFDEGDPLHRLATEFFEAGRGEVTWYVVDATSHESFTRVRYNATLPRALAAFQFLRDGGGVGLLRFQPEDEDRALTMLRKYRDQRLSFHDALCAAVMLRVGIFRVFTFDQDFSTMGFAVMPGLAR